MHSPRASHSPNSSLRPSNGSIVIDIHASSNPQQEEHHPNANEAPAARPFSDGNVVAPSFISRHSLNPSLRLIPSSVPTH